MDNLLLFGGTFDPIHNGHLNIARGVQDFFHFDNVAFLPCKLPVLQKNLFTTSSQHRLAMLQIALAELPKKYHFHIEKREINRNSPSYTVTTLEEFREKFGKQKPITLLLGFDAFCQLPQWHRWQEVIELANLLIINRPDYEKTKLPDALQILLSSHKTADPHALLKTPHGLIARFNAGEYPISSTAVRESLFANKLPTALLPQSICHYIIEKKLYCLK